MVEETGNQDLCVGEKHVWLKLVAPDLLSGSTHPSAANFAKSDPGLSEESSGDMQARALVTADREAGLGSICCAEVLSDL